MQFQFDSILTTDDPEPAHIVKDFLYQGQMLIWAGEPGVGKSFLMYNLSMCIACNLPFLGMPTHNGTVLYFDEENSHPDASQYWRWVWRGLGEPTIQTIQQNLCFQHFSLASHGQRRYEYMAKLAAEVKPSLIVIDTATPACNIEDENDNAEAGRIITHLRMVKEAAGSSTTMVVLKHARIFTDHHAKVGEVAVRTIRGAKIWLGALDGVIYHTLTNGKPRRDNLRGTQLAQDKVRAFGLRNTLKLIPKWIGKHPKMGLVLERKISPPLDDGE